MDVLCQAKSGMGKTAGACPAACCCGAAWRSPARRAGAAGPLGPRRELVAADAGFRACSVRAVGAAAAGARGERSSGHRALPHPRAGVSGVVPASAAASGLLCSSVRWLPVSRIDRDVRVPGAQICHEFERFSVYMKVKVANFFGGLPIKQQKETLKKDCPQVIIGTPGRLKAVRGGAPARCSVASSCFVPSVLTRLSRRAAGQGGRPEAGLRAALHR